MYQSMALLLENPPVSEAPVVHLFAHHFQIMVLELFFGGKFLLPVSLALTYVVTLRIKVKR